MNGDTLRCGLLNAAEMTAVFLDIGFQHDTLYKT